MVRRGIDLEYAFLDFLFLGTRHLRRAAPDMRYVAGEDCWTAIAAVAVSLQCAITGRAVLALEGRGCTPAIHESETGEATSESESV